MKTLYIGYAGNAESCLLFAKYIRASDESDAKAQYEGWLRQTGNLYSCPRWNAPFEHIVQTTIIQVGEEAHSHPVRVDGS